MIKNTSRYVRIYVNLYKTISEFAFTDMCSMSEWISVLKGFNLTISLDYTEQVSGTAKGFSFGNLYGKLEKSGISIPKFFMYFCFWLKMRKVEYRRME